MSGPLVKVAALAACLLTCTGLLVLSLAQLRPAAAALPLISRDAGSQVGGNLPTADPAAQAPAPVVAGPGPVGPRLLIPRLAVDAAIESVGLDSKHRIGVASSGSRVGWYRDSPWPGGPGSAILDGHLTYGSGAAVFADLGRLRAGDALTVVDAAGHRLDFRVDRLDRYAPNASPEGLFATAGPARLALITCAGAWDAAAETYLERLVVRASPVGRS